MKHIIILMLSLMLVSCGSGGSDPNNTNNVHDEISDLGLYVGYAPMKVVDRQGLVHDWYQLYTSKVSAGIYLKTEPTNQYPIITGQTTYWKVLMKRRYDNTGPTNDPVYIYIGQSNDMSHADEFMADIPGQIFQ